MTKPNHTDITKTVDSLHLVGDSLAKSCGIKTESGNHGSGEDSTELQVLRSTIDQIHRIAHDLATLYKVEDRHWTSRAGVRGSWGPDKQQPSG